MKKILILLIAVTLAIFEAYQGQGTSVAEGLLQTFDVANSSTENNSLQQAYNNKQSNLQVQGSGIVVKVLRDDLKGSRHQKFILQIAPGLTVLVAHNIDLAPRIDGLQEGDRVEFNGEYEWNSRGGVIHWTHKDPGNRHETGWLKHQGRVYQ